MTWEQLLLTALTGGLAGAFVTQGSNWLQARNRAKRQNIAVVDALKQELRLSLWLIEYNYGRIDRKLLYTGLTRIDTSNVERVLFGTEVSLRLSDDAKARLLDYLQQVVYLNSLVAEQAPLTPTYPYNFVSERQASCLGEIQAICTPKDTYRDGDPEPSLRARVRRLLQDLDELKP